MEAKKHILVAEDEPSCLRPLSLILRRSGYEVSTASNGQEALHALESSMENGRPIDMLLCDIFMPDTDGISLIRTIRLHEIPVPVAVMTGCVDEATTRALKEAGCLHVIAKPFFKEEIFRVIAAVLEPAGLNDALAAAVTGDERATSERPFHQAVGM